MAERRPSPAGAAAILGAIVLVTSCAVVDRVAEITALEYPPARRETVTDEYHGMAVADPYRWMEAITDRETTAWVAAQNALTAQYIAALPGRSGFASRLRRLVNYERMGVPMREAGIYVYTFNPGLAEQDAIWVTPDPATPGRVLVDPAALSADGTVSLGDFRLSPDGRLLAYSVSDGGSDWRTWRVREVATGRDRPDVIAGTKFTEASWARDSRGFYYSRYPRAEQWQWDDRRQASLYYHALGTDPAGDRQVYAITDHRTREPYGEVSEDGRYLVITVQDGFRTNGLYYLPLEPGSGSEPVRLFDDWDARYEFLGNDGAVFYVLTTREAPKGRVIAVDLDNPGADSWRTVVPESSVAIDAAHLSAGRIVVHYVSDAHSELRVFAAEGGPGFLVPLPGTGTVSGFAGSGAESQVFFSYTDFTTPRMVFEMNSRQGTTRAIRPPAGVAADRYAVEQVFVTSADGTRLPMYVTRRRDLSVDEPRPTVLYGYGGFGVSLLPAYSAARMAWLEAGGVFAQANLRGGGEYGDEWHRAGTKAGKQNVFDDFIAAAEWLIDSGYTSPQHLAIWGGSNGGLLVAAVANQRPELFTAVVPAVGVLDMLRYQIASLNARKWSSDYGLSDNAGEFSALVAYSPYHNVREGQCYPATLVQADANDDRVSPWHSYKYAAALQRAQGCSRPVLLRTETRSGHGAGASVSKIIDEYADQWAFVAAAVGLLPGNGHGGW